MAPGTSVRVLVVPVFKRYWLWHAWKSAPASSTPPKPWQEGSTVQEKFKLLLGSIQRWGGKQGEQQWHKLATAQEGTFNHKLFRCAVSVTLSMLPQQQSVRMSAASTCCTDNVQGPATQLPAQPSCLAGICQASL